MRKGSFFGYWLEFLPFCACWMSRKMYDACPSRKKLVTVPGAGHGLSFPVAPEEYLQKLGEFFPHKEKDRPGAGPLIFTLPSS